MRQELVHLGNGAHALAIQILGNSEDAADAVHDAFASVLEKPGSWDRQCYETLEEAVVLVNRFLAESAATIGWPAADTEVELGLTDILVHLPGRGTEAMRIETSGWGDLRTFFGDEAHANGNGFTSYPDTGAHSEDAADNVFFRKDAVDMAAFLLRQAMIMREIRERGETNYWMNYRLLGLDPRIGWGRRSHVDQTAVALEKYFREWVAEQGIGEEA